MKTTSNYTVATETWIIDATPAHCPDQIIIRRDAPRGQELTPLAMMMNFDGRAMERARVMAAAPALLAELEAVTLALEQLIECTEGMVKQKYQARLASVRAVIATTK